MIKPEELIARFSQAIPQIGNAGLYSYIKCDLQKDHQTLAFNYSSFGAHTRSLTIEIRTGGQTKKQKLELREVKNGFWPLASDIILQDMIRYSITGRNRFGIRRTLFSVINTDEAVQEANKILGILE